MSELPFYTKDLAETSNSFFPSSGFEYRNQEKAIDFGLLRETQKQRIINLFKNDPFFTQEKLLSEFQRIQQQSNRFIHVLLEQLAIQSKKVRLIQNQHDGVLRQKNIYARKLTQKNIQLVSSGQVELKYKEDEKKSLEKGIRQSKKVAQSYKKELEGLKRLLEQYEQELELLQKKLNQKNGAIKLKDQTIALMVQKIDQLNLSICKYKQNEGRILSQADSFKDKLSSNKNLAAKLQFMNIKLEEALKKCRQLQKDIIEFRNKEKYQKQTIFKLESQVSKAQQKHFLQQRRYQKLKSQHFQQIQSLTKREHQLKLSMQDLETKTKNSIQKLKQNYEVKIKKIVRLLQKQVKHLRTSFQNTKQFLQKQILLCFSLLQRDFRLKSKPLQSQN